MLRQKHSVVHIKKHADKYKKMVRVFLAVVVALAFVGRTWQVSDDSYASGCPDVKVVFARGSGGERYNTKDYLAFRGAMEEKLQTSDLRYEVEDLDYPAVSIDIGEGHLGTLLGAYVGSGEAYDFGESVRVGTQNLARMINNDGCRDTKYVLAGYSQGTLVIMNALDKVDANKVLYAATFGDPKIYLPEGAGLVPKACGGIGLSDYRVYVPDCRAYKGMLGGREPYRAEIYEGKVGVWCNRYDVLCSSQYSIESHTSYVEDGLYEDASRFIYAKIAVEFGFRGQYTSPHDTAILIDSTGSMYELIDKYKEEAMRLAEKTLETGGRVALYDYRDLGDGYTPVERCNFETCDLETFRAGLDVIGVDGGGDEPESLLSGSLHVMNSLDWKFGSTKSLVILTDAGYHSPDLDGTTFYDVKKLSKEIDPVNFYIITEPENVGLYSELAEATDGEVVSSVDDLSLLTDNIMERYDSLPRVEESEEGAMDLPALVIEDVINNEDDSVKVIFKNSGLKAMVFLNDALLGVTDKNEVTITGIRGDVKNVVTLAPLSEDRRGDSVSVVLEEGVIQDNGKNMADNGDNGMDRGGINKMNVGEYVIPKAPNTGRR